METRTLVADAQTIAHAHAAEAELVELRARVARLSQVENAAIVFLAARDRASLVALARTVAR